MNKKHLEREGKKWVDDGLISESQLEAILQKYVKEDRSYILVILAALLVSISVIVFIFSDWAQIPNVSRITIMILMMHIFYTTGFYYERKKERHEPKQRQMHKQTYSRSQIIGISLIIIGYITFGATLLLTLYMYNVQLQSSWPFLIWSIVGIMLYVIVPNRYLFSIALLITIYGQIHSHFTYAAFDYVLFILFFVVYFHFVYHRGHTIIHYIFSIGLILQWLMLSMNEFHNFYWFMLFILAMYGLSILLPKKTIKSVMMRVTVIGLLFYKMYETLTVQESFIMDSLTYQPSFFILYTIIFLGVALLLLLLHRRELITLLLFVPMFFLPYAHLFIIISLFIYAIYWLIYGFQTDTNSKIMLGLFSFFLSVFTIIIQYAWETINKSLFFLVAGIVLFIISILLERKRQKNEGGTM